MSGVTENYQLDARARWIRRTIVVSADLESLITTHDESSLAVLLVLEQSNIASASLLPLSRIAIKLEELGAHLEDLLLRLFVGL
jgi:hypothetical protein